MTTGNDGLAALRPRQRRIAEFVSEGLTNNEIASALALSPKTVEAHLGRTYRKLGLRSRTELVRFVLMSRVGGDTDRKARPTN